MKSFTLLLIFMSACALSQVSLANLKTLGVDSEDDLKKLGVSQREIDKAKKEISINEPKPKKEAQKKETKKKLETQKVTKPDILISTYNPEKVFGQNYFQQGYFNLKKNTHRINPPGNYILGPGDNIGITIWGTSEFGNQFILDEFGNINPEIVGRINLRGLTFTQAKQVIRSRFSRVYNLQSSKTAINLTYSKVISVNIVGEVKRPGTYSVPGINSAFNLISLAGGVTELGSVRTIEIRREGKVISNLDLYKFILNPDEFTDVFLQDGDYIVVKTQGAVINIKGEIKRPGKFEVTQKDNIEEILNIAGGFSAYANKDEFNVKRVVENKWVFMSYKLDSPEFKKLSLNNGDEVEILKISNIIYGLVKITGAINIEGEYTYKKGMRINDLISQAGKLNKNSYLEHAQLFRSNPNLSLSVLSFNLKEIIRNPKSSNNFLLKENDSIVIFDNSKLNFKKSITTRGALNKTGSIDFANGLTLNDVILKSNGLKMNADHKMIEVERISYSAKDSNSSYIEVISLEYPRDKTFEINSDDIINFRSLPSFVGQKSIVISGEVRYPGEYTLNGSDEKLSDLIKRAGGLTNWAFLEGSQLKRQEDDLGLILMNLKQAINKPNSKYNYILNPNDSISIPKNSNIVSISGAIGYKNVNNNNNIISSPFHKNLRAGFYIRKYGGGYSKEAKKRMVYVIGSNGLVKESKIFGTIKPKVKSGDKIIVKSKEEKKQKVSGEKVNWNSVIENVTLKATAILTLLVLTQQAFN